MLTYKQTDKPSDKTEGQFMSESWCFASGQNMRGQFHCSKFDLHLDKQLWPINSHIWPWPFKSQSLTSLSVIIKAKTAERPSIDMIPDAQLMEAEFYYLHCN